MGFVALLSYIVPFQAGADHRAGIRAERNSWPEYNFRTGVFEREPVPANIDSDILASESIIIPRRQVEHLWQAAATSRDISGPGTDFSRPCRTEPIPCPTSSVAAHAVVQVPRSIRWRLTPGSPGRGGKGQLEEARAEWRHKHPKAH